MNKTTKQTFRNFVLAGTVVLSMVGMQSCEKDSDTTKPVITLNAPTDHFEVKPGSDIHFDVEFSDNEALGSYKVNIHGAFDGHSHDHEATLRHEGEELGEEFARTWTEDEFIKLGETPIRGKRNAHVHHHHIVIPGDKLLREGHYHFMVYCTDAAGNETLVAREIEISYEADEHEHHH